MNYGTYEYFLNNEPTGITEKFNVENLADGTTISISERNSSVYETMIYTNAELIGNRFKSFEINITNKKNYEVADVHASYQLTENQFEFTRQINGKTTDKFIQNLPNNCVIFPLMRCFQGHAILQVAHNQAVTPVLVPDIQNPNDAENLLKPTFDKRTAKLIKKETIAFYEPESVSLETNLYQYLSKHYDDNSQFWINDEGLLVAYQFVQAADKIWTIKLKQT
jgi:hypothetical protein